MCRCCFVSVLFYFILFCLVITFYCFTSLICCVVSFLLLPSCNDTIDGLEREEDGKHNVRCEQELKRLKEQARRQKKRWNLLALSCFVAGSKSRSCSLLWFEFEQFSSFSSLSDSFDFLSFQPSFRRCLCSRFSLSPVRIFVSIITVPKGELRLTFGWLSARQMHDSTAITITTYSNHGWSTSAMQCLLWTDGDGEKQRKTRNEKIEIRPEFTYSILRGREGNCFFLLDSGFLFHRCYSLLVLFHRCLFLPLKRRIHCEEIERSHLVPSLFMVCSLFSSSLSTSHSSSPLLAYRSGWSTVKRLSERTAPLLCSAALMGRMRISSLCSSKRTLSAFFAFALLFVKKKQK